MAGWSHAPKPGVGSVGQYQISGRPWVTGSVLNPDNPNSGETKIEFPYVTKSFTVINRASGSIHVHFDSKANANVAAQLHHITLPTVNDGFVFNVRAKEVYLSMSGSQTGSFELIAELTGIDRSEMPYVYSGSGVNELAD